MGPNPSAALDEYYEIYYIISLKLINRVYNKGIFYDLRSSRTGCLLLLNNQLHFSAIFSMMIFPNSSFDILGYCCNVPSLYNMAAILVVTLNPAPGIATSLAISISKFFLSTLFRPWAITSFVSAAKPTRNW